MHGTTNGSIRLYTRRQVKGGGLADGLLNQYCALYKLALGDPVIYGGWKYVTYFEHYGLSESAFYSVFSRDMHLRIGCGTHDWQEGLKIFARVYGLPIRRYCPRYIHVYEQVQKRYPHFSWQIVQDPPGVVFRNYPCSDDGSETPTLLDLLVRDEPLCASQSCLIRMPSRRKPVRRRRMAACY